MQAGAAGGGRAAREEEVRTAWYPRLVQHSEPPTITHLPGGELVAAGLEDWRRDVDSVPALVARIGAPRLRQLGLDVPAPEPDAPLPEHRLYERLARDHGDAAHSRYNALIRQLVSFTHARACVR